MGSRGVVAAVLVVGALVVLADVVLGVFSRPAVWLEHVVTQLVLWPFIWVDRVELLPHRPRAVVAFGIVFGALGVLLEGGGRVAHGVRDAVLGVPAGLLALAVLGAGLGLAPGVTLACAAAFGLGWLRRVDVPAGRVGEAALVFAAALGIPLLGTVLASGPGDPQLPFLGVAAVGQRAPSEALVLGCTAAVAALGWRGWKEPGPLAGGGLLVALVAALYAPDGGAVRHGLLAAPLGLACGMAGVGLGPGDRAGLVGLIRRALPPVLAAICGLAHTAAVGFLGCDRVAADPAITVLDPRPGTFAVQPIPAGPGLPRGAIVSTLRDQQLLLWRPLDGRPPVVHALATLPLEAWGSSEQFMRAAFPEELGLDPHGRVHVWIEVPDPGSERVRLLLDAGTGAILEIDELPTACFVSSWLWDVENDHAVAGCEWNGEVMIDGATGWRRAAVEGAGELEELLAVDGQWIGSSLWSSPWLVRIDPDRLTVTDRTPVGTFVWGLAALPDQGLIAVPRFLAGGLLFVDAESLTPRRSVRVGWGVRAITQVPNGPVLTASAYDGHLYAVDPSGASPTRKLHVGGWTRDLDLLDPDTLVLGGACGVLQIDLPSWLDR